MTKTDAASVVKVAPTSYNQTVVMPQASHATLPLQSTPATAPSSSLQEDTTDDDYSFMNSS